MLQIGNPPRPKLTKVIPRAALPAIASSFEAEGGKLPPWTSSFQGQQKTADQLENRPAVY
jgi:hypothetical protein